MLTGGSTAPYLAWHCFQVPDGAPMADLPGGADVYTIALLSGALELRASQTTQISKTAGKLADSGKPFTSFSE